MIQAIKRAIPEERAGRAEFERVAMPHLDAVYRTARWMTRNEHEAEDLVQETYFRAFRAFHRFQADTNCKAWLLKILANLNADRFSRSATRRENVRFEDVQPFLGKDADRGPQSERPEPADLKQNLDDEVNEAVEEVPELFRTPLLLSSVQGLSYAQISAMLKCPLGTVMSRIHRGRQFLKNRLADYAVANGYRV
jgi:RNA polymerase sigma-70 factor (ECF subfamily)